MRFYHLVTIAGAILSQLIVLRLVYSISPAEYGYFSLMTVFAQVIFIFVLGWNDSLILNYGTREFIENGHIKKVLKVRFGLIFCSLPIVFSFVFFLKGFITQFLKNDDFFSLALVYFFSDFFFNLGSHIFFAKDRNILQAGLNFFPKIVQFFYVFFCFTSIENYVWLSFFINFVTFFVVFTIYQKEEWSVSANLNGGEVLFFFKFSLFQFLSIASIYIINWGDNFVMSYYDINMIQIGSYNFSYKIFLGFHFIFALTNIIIPKAVYKFKKDGNFQSFSPFLARRKPFVFALGFSYAIAIFFMRWLLVFLGKIDYLESISFSIWLLIPFLFMAASDFIVPIILNSPFYKDVQKAVFYQAMINVLFNMIFTFFYGVYGVIIGTSFAYFYKFIHLELVYQKNVLPYLYSYRKD